MCWNVTRPSSERTGSNRERSNPCSGSGEKTSFSRFNSNCVICRLSHIDSSETIGALAKPTSALKATSAPMVISPAITNRAPTNRNSATVRNVTICKTPSYDIIVKSALKRRRDTELNCASIN